MIAIVDYGAGNMFSLQSSLNRIGEESCVCSDRESILNADAIILPGVGAFGDAAKKLSEQGLDRVIVEAVNDKKPLLGICLGMQLLFTESYEYGVHRGLNLIEGSVTGLKQFAGRLKVPHMGWNTVTIKKNRRIFKYCSGGEYVYFVHSYCAVTAAKNISATTYYGAEICAAAEKENVFGTQFHPEKSGETGLKILKGFADLKEK